MGQVAKLIPEHQSGVIPNQLVVDVGTATYTTTSTSATYRTNLNFVVGGVVNLINDASIATDEKSMYSVPSGAVSNGAITVSRSSHQAISGASVFVMLIGYQYDTVAT